MPRSDHKSADGRIYVAVRLTPDVHERLMAIVNDRDVSIQFVLNRAVERYLDTLPTTEGL